MPKVMPVYDPTDTRKWDALNAAADAERKARNEFIDRAWQYYEGDHPKPLRIKPGGPDHNVILNLAGEAVDKMVAFLGAPKLEVIGGVQREPNAAGILETLRTPEQEVLDAFWQANDLQTLITDLLLDAAVAGHTFMRLIRHDDNSIEAALLDGRYVTVFWNATKVKERLFYRIAWQDGDEMRVQDILPMWLAERQPPSEPSPWVIVEYLVNSSGKYQEVGRDVWDFPFPPIVDWKNLPKPHSYYGKSDLARVGLNDAVNFAASNINKILYHHAGPQTVLTGGKLEQDQESGPGTILEIEDEGAKLYNLEMQSDLQSSLQFLDVLRGAYFAEARVVDPTTVKDRLGALTNFAVRMLYTDQLDAGYMKALLHGRGLAEVSRRVLLMFGFKVERVEAKWEDPLPVDRGEVVKAAETENKIGVTSKQTLQEALGRDPDEEAERMEEETARGQDAVANVLVNMGRRGLLS